MFGLWYSNIAPGDKLTMVKTKRHKISLKNIKQEEENTQPSGNITIPVPSHNSAETKQIQCKSLSMQSCVFDIPKCRSNTHL